MGDDRDSEEHRGVSEREVEDIEDHSRLRAPVIYEIVRQEGEEEMDRPLTSLWWSGVAAGLSISFSLFAQGVLHTSLPDEAWRPLVTSLGYSVGFLIVVLARQQLFTENTITVVMPLMAEFTRRNLMRTARLWAVVFAANMVGTFFAAGFCALTPVLEPRILHGMLALSREMMAHGWGEMLFRGIASGFLIAAMVWLIPSAEGTQFHVITLMTYLIAVGGFTHIVAGSVEAFLLVIADGMPIGRMAFHFALPVLIGNVIGGTALFTLISYAQVMREI